MGGQRSGKKDLDRYSLSSYTSSSDYYSDDYSYSSAAYFFDSNAGPAAASTGNHRQHGHHHHHQQPHSAEQSSGNNNGVAPVAAETKEKLIEDGAKAAGPASKGQKEAIKYGWIRGVFIRVILSLFGVYPWLRFPWIVAESGVGLAWVNLLFSLFMVYTTTLSLSLLASNGRMRGGGCYYLASRVIGPEFGAVIGVMFSFSLTLAMASKVMGFAEAVVAAEVQSGEFLATGNEHWDQRMWGIVGLTLILVLVLIGIDVVVKNDAVQLVLLLVCLLLLFIGAFATKNKPDNGFYRASNELFRENWHPKFTPHEFFFHQVAVLFPSLTGLMAGLNVSGDLKDPATAVPAGTLGGITANGIMYFTMITLAGACFARTVPGHAKEGSYANKTIFVRMSIFGPSVYAGIMISSLASAISNLVGAPRILMALSRDGVIPIPRIFAKGYGPQEEPRGGYILAYLIGVILILAVDLTQIASLVTNFFMLVYCLLNFGAFWVCSTQPPGWRPTYKWCNRWVCFVGAWCYLVSIFLMSWTRALIGIGIATVIYIFSYWWIRRPANRGRRHWGALMDDIALSNAAKLAREEQPNPNTAKLYRPNIIFHAPLTVPLPPLVDDLVQSHRSTLLSRMDSEEPEPVSVAAAAKLIGFPGSSLAPNTILFQSAPTEKQISDARSSRLSIMHFATPEAQKIAKASIIHVYWLNPEDKGPGLFLATLLRHHSKGFKNASITVFMGDDVKHPLSEYRVRAQKEVRLPANHFSDNIALISPLETQVALRMAVPDLCIVLPTIASLVQIATHPDIAAIPGFIGGRQGANVLYFYGNHHHVFSTTL